MGNIYFQLCSYTDAVCIASSKCITRKSNYVALCDSGTQARGLYAQD